MLSLEGNNTFNLTPLPPGTQAVGGRWVNTLKSDTDGSDKYKVRFLAKGYSQKPGTDWKETFSLTTEVKCESDDAKGSAGISALHQMDVKMANLHAPVDCELYCI